MELHICFKGKQTMEKCDYCGQPAKMTVYYGLPDDPRQDDYNSVPTLQLCFDCSPPLNHPADPYASFSREVVW